jgi:hypothetical protein
MPEKIFLLYIIDSGKKQYDRAVVVVMHDRLLNFVNNSRIILEILLNTVNVIIKTSRNVPEKMHNCGQNVYCI